MTKTMDKAMRWSDGVIGLMLMTWGVCALVGLASALLFGGLDPAMPAAQQSAWKAGLAVGGMTGVLVGVGVLFGKGGKGCACGK